MMDVQVIGECVCGSKNFMHEDGKTFCLECQTELESAKEIVYENYDDYGLEIGDQTQRSRVLTTTVKKQKVKTSDLPTSWECFNQVLCNLVDEIEEIEENVTSYIKRDFKLTVLQMWTAYLRHNGKAFFSKESADYPKFDANFKMIDAEIIYKIKRPPKKTNVPKQIKASANSRVRKRETRNIKRKANQMELSKHNNTIQENATKQTSNILIQYTPQSIEYLKTQMSEDHMLEHERDPTLTCHKITVKNLSGVIKQITKVSLYTLLYMALNHVESEIQIGDLLRFMKEGHITSDHLSTVSNDARFNLKFKKRSATGSPLPPSHENLRSEALDLSKEIGYQFKKPDIGALYKRYLKELCLPPEIGSLIDVILNVHPPTMGERRIASIPNYEARAMAYILFMLKLLFGLDDEREYKISSSSCELNKKICVLNEKIDQDRNKQKRLFVWCDWVQYIEMRNNLLVQLHFPTAMESYTIGDDMTPMYLEYLTKMDEKQADDKSAFKSNAAVFQRIKNEFQTLYNLNPKCNETLAFNPSLTPKRSYMEELLCNDQSNIFIPRFMEEMHDKLDIESFLRPSKLQAFFRQHKIKLTVNKLRFNENIRLKRSYETDCTGSVTYEKYCNFNFDISTKDWFNEMKKQKENEAKLDTQADVVKEAVTARLMEIKQYNRKAKEKKKENHLSQDQQQNLSSSPTEMHVPLISETIQLNDIFDSVSTDEDEENGEPFQPADETLNLTISDFDYWLLLGPRSYLNTEFPKIKNKMSQTFQWLLKRCADLIENRELDVYFELIIIENYFSQNVKPCNDTYNNLLKRHASKKNLGLLYRKY